MYLLIIFLPLLCFLIILLFGKWVGPKYIIFISLFFLSNAFILILKAFYNYYTFQQIVYIDLFSWIHIENLVISWSFLFDSLTIIMLFIIISIAFLVQIFSIDYMNLDPHLNRFFSYLSLFTFFMILLVTSNNFFQLFIGWEGVGLCSYLLISFWFTRIQGNKAALKAILFNKIGDCSLLLALGLIYYSTASLDFDIFFSSSNLLIMKSIYFSFNFFDIDIFNLIGILLFIGVMGKSAQFGLHSWLPDAMEGPTPVSALIHAATMVTAGVFLLIRCSYFFEQIPVVLEIIMYIGGFTSIFAGTIGLFQYDLKKVIAYSTCSQLGYMILCCGLSYYNLSLFHLFNHAFFKALLFLSAGSIIHAVADEQDFRKLGGLHKLLPLTYFSFLIGTLSLLGFPFMSGFYSKDIIFEFCFFQRYNLEIGFELLQMDLNYYKYNSFFSLMYYFLFIIFLSKNFVLIAVFFVILLTAAYSWRVLYYIFFGNVNGFKSIYLSINESLFHILFVLIILSFASIFIGYFFNDLFIGLGTDFFNNSIYISPFNNVNQIIIKSELFNTIFLKYCPLICMFCFIFFGSFLSNKNFQNNFYIIGLIKKVYSFFIYRWFFDKIVNHFVCFFLKLNLYKVYKQLDKGLIEFFGPKGVRKLIFFICKKCVKYETGFLILIFSNFFIFFIFLVYIFSFIYFVFL